MVPLEDFFSKTLVLERFHSRGAAIKSKVSYIRTLGSVMTPQKKKKSPNSHLANQMHIMSILLILQAAMLTMR